MRSRISTSSEVAAELGRLDRRREDTSRELRMIDEQRGRLLIHLRSIERAERHAPAPRGRRA